MPETIQDYQAKEQKRKSAIKKYNEKTRPVLLPLKLNNQLDILAKATKRKKNAMLEIILEEQLVHYYKANNLTLQN